MFKISVSEYLLKPEILQMETQFLALRICFCCKVESSLVLESLSHVKVLADPCESSAHPCLKVSVERKGEK